jgi:hypothetical protein
MEEDSPERKIVLTESTAPKKTRAIINSKKWDIMKEKSSYTHGEQYSVIEGLEKNDTQSTPIHDCMIKEIQKKIAGYKTQDINKGLYDSTKIVNLEDVIHLLFECKMICYYCKTDVHVLYEIVREVSQWTLDRLDNKHGHNRGNVVISCLKCNLNRKTMYHERYAFTRTFTLVKKLDG